MKIANRNIVYREHSRFNKPSISVESGEEFLVHTELCSGEWLKRPEDIYSIDKCNGPNPSVCIEVIGAKPGDVIAVKINDIEVEEIGYTAMEPSRRKLPYLIHKKNWEVAAKTLRIENGLINWSDKIKIPVRPMLGTLGTAPAIEVIDNSKAGHHGGNMDVNEVCAGNTIYLPVYVEGALLHVGDGHAIQGDGELPGDGGVECRTRVRMSVEIIAKPKRMEWIRIENNEYIMAIACCRSVEESFYEAAEEILVWMADEYDFTEEDAFLLMGQLMEARCTQYVNPTRSYICKMPKKYLLGSR